MALPNALDVIAILTIPAILQITIMVKLSLLYSEPYPRLFDVSKRDHCYFQHLQARSEVKSVQKEDFIT